MNDVLKIILSLSLSGTLLIFILYLFRPLFKKRLSKGWQYYIWLVVIARLLLPLALEPNLMGTLFLEFDSNAQQTQMIGVPSGEEDSSATEDTVFSSENQRSVQSAGDDIGGQTAGASSDLLQSLLTALWQNLWFCWGIMALILLIRKITIYQSFVKYIRAGCVEVERIDLLEKFGTLIEKNKVRSRVELYTNNLISSPLLIGFFRPCIVLPSDDLSESEFEYTILHELTHYKRGDMFYKWLVQLTVCVHWFNPFVYLMSREINKACELSCDETIIKRADLQGRRLYGDTLLHAMGTGGRYKNAIASVTLNESKELLKERLDMIMGFKKKTRLNATVSILLVFALCFGATVTGAYAVSPSSNVEEKGITTVRQSNPQKLGNLTLIKKEYTIKELKKQKISGVVVEGISEDVTILRGGKTLKFQYYTGNKSEYALKREDDGGKTRWNLCLTRVSTQGKEDVQRTITITIPEKVNLKILNVDTASGDIRMKNCTASTALSAFSKSGQILIEGGSASRFLMVETKSSNALISGTILPNKEETPGTSFETGTGTIMFQPADKAANYCYNIDTGRKAEVRLNGRKYPGGDYEINKSAKKSVCFDSSAGSFIVQDLDKGKLSITGSMTAAGTDQGMTTPKKRTYTKSDLRKAGITGLRVQASSEDIIVSQGGKSLKFEYSRPGETKYTLNTRTYELYNEEYISKEELAKKGGKSGKVKELVLTSKAVSKGAGGRIHITLPSGTKYNRVVQLSSESGSIQIENCTSSDMLDVWTKAGTISVKNCSSPMLGVESGSGQIKVTGCKMNQLNSQTVKGNVIVQLVDRTESYKMIIDTKAANISINGKKYKKREFVLHKKASKMIYFDSKEGSLTITESKK